MQQGQTICPRFKVLEIPFIKMRNSKQWHFPTAIITDIDYIVLSNLTLIGLPFII